MYLIKLEISGFKSFAARTKIEFDQGITAIVGPNGSGKSNITEALRWVMGEQSAKSLRGGKMPDVIFSGTEKRKAQNAAEVVAHFDNKDHYLEGDDEVVITRRLYRNGESDYLINGKKKRLKDIHDLFMDTGTGRDSLSIISQGRIEGIFSAKPEDRRAIFEEAAGVLKYKTRKKDTETKLAGTKGNLDRLEDIIFELNGQLTPLRAQRAAALKFQKYEEERHQLQLSVLVTQIQSGMKRHQEGKGKLSQAQEALAQSVSEQVAYEEEVMRLKKRRSQAEQELEEVQDQVLNLTTLKSDAQSRMALFESQKNASEQSAKERESRALELEERQAQEAASFEVVKENLAKNKQRESALKIELDALDQELSSLLGSPEEQIEALRANYLDLVNREAEWTNNLTKAQAESDSILRRSQENDETDKETAGRLRENQEKLQEARNQHEKLKKELDELLVAYQKLAREENQEKEKIQKAEKAALELSDQLMKRRAKLSSLENIRENHSNLYAGVRAVMQDNPAGVVGVVADLMSFEAKYATALDIAVGAGAQNIVTEDEKVARLAINFLRDKKLGRATFLPLTTIKPRHYGDYQKIKNQPGFIDLAVNLVKFDGRLADVFSNLLGRTLIVDTAENATNLARSIAYTARIVTLDGTQINPGGSYAGGSRSRNATNFTSNEIGLLEQEIKTLKKSYQEQENELATLRESQKLMAENLENLRQDGENKRLAERELEVRVAQLEESEKDLKELLSLSNTGQDTERLAQLSTECQKIKEEIGKITQLKTDLESDLETLQANSKNQTALKNEKQEKLTQLKLDEANIQAEIKHQSAEEVRLKESLSNLTKEIENLRNQTNQQSDQPNEATAQSPVVSKETLEVQLKGAEGKLAAASVKQVSLRFERDDLAAQLEDLESQNSSNLKANQELQSQKTRLEIENEQIAGQLSGYQEKLTEDYQLSFEAAKAAARSLESFSAAESRLKELERQIRALGPINIESIEQYDAIKERYDFLESQKEDLLSARQLLIDNINEMDDEVRSRFQETFDKIKYSFQVTFSQMFAGGFADLVLTGDDLLTTGIEITVQPPGKKLANLSLMSGGEKALTALALLFAILRVRTVPFVVLDEVEAALDETNVRRFGDYMNHFDSSNQFIVVTHRKGTMQAADVLYGITMIDAGVSKLVSVKFDETDKVLAQSSK